MLARAQEPYEFRLAAVRCDGGGDWYQGEMPLANLIAFVRAHSLADVVPEADVVLLIG